MLSQLCRAQLWPKPSRKWSRHFPRGIRRKLGQGHIDAPNIVHFNCSTNNLQGITDHCSDDAGDSSCCSDEDNDCSSGGFEDTCSEYSCATSMPFSQECCCCCQVAENPAYGLSMLHPHAPQFSSASDTTSSSLENYHQQGENDYIPLWNSREPSCDSTFRIIPPKVEERDKVSTAAEQPSTGYRPTRHNEEDNRKTTRLRGVLSDRDSPSAFRVVVPKPVKSNGSRLPAVSKAAHRIERKQMVPAVDPLSVRVMPDPTVVIQSKRLEQALSRKHSAQQIRTCQTKLKRFSICEADGVLQRASPQNPAQVPMVVMQCARLHLSLNSSPPFQQTSLPMGTLVTALYRHEDWICVQTPHGVMGYLFYTNCTPLGILPASKKLEPWETSICSSWNLREDLQGGTVSKSQNNQSVADSQSAKKSNMRLQARNRENGARRTKVDNKVRRLNSSGGKQTKVVYMSKTNVENVRATLQRNLASQKPSPDAGRGKEAEKIVEKNIDKLISTTTTGLKDSGSELAAALKMLRIEGVSIANGHSGVSKA